MRPRGVAVLALVAASALVVSAIPARARVFRVDRTDDDPSAASCADAAASDCSLRGALTAANALPGADEIDLPGGTYTLTVPSTDFEDANANGDLDVTDDLTLHGDGAGATIVQGCAVLPPSTSCTATNRVLDVDPTSKGITVAIDGLTIRYGHLDRYADHAGGGIRNRGTLTLADCIVTMNAAVNPSGISSGGGISHEGGTLTLLGSTVSDNEAYIGGGILAGDGTSLAVTDSTIIGNLASYSGGGIYAGAFDISGKPSIVIVRSTITENVANTGNGGGIDRNRGTLTMVDSTVSNNEALAGLGGGVQFDFGNGGPHAFSNVTISGNQAVAGGGVESKASTALLDCTVAGNTAHGVLNAREATGGGIEGQFTLANTIIAGNLSDFAQAPDCAGTVASNGYNLIQDTTGCSITGDLTGNVTGQDPKLAALADNGGPTQTRALLATSPAVDAGNPTAPGSGGSACRPADQRGVLRPKGAACDIGAFESPGNFRISTAPTRGGNTGPLTVFVYGGDFASDAMVKLARVGEADIVGDPVGIGNDGSVITTRFDLTARTPGAWDVVVESRGTALSAPGAFTIDSGGAPRLWVVLLGHAALRIGVPSPYTVLFGNTGNVDAVGVPLALAIPSELAPQLRTPITPPPPQPGQVSTDWSQAELSVTTDPLSEDVTIPLLLPLVPVGSTGAVDFTLTPAAGTHGVVFHISVGLGSPYLHPDLDPDAVDTRVEGARAFAERALGVVIPPARDPDLRQYLANQFRNAVDDAQSATVSGLGTDTRVYSLAQFVLDLAEFGAASVGASLESPRVYAREAPWIQEVIGSFLAPIEAEAAGVCPVGRACKPSCTEEGGYEGVCMGCASGGTFGCEGATITSYPCCNKGETIQQCCAAGRPSLYPIGPVDPNDKVGPPGAGPPRFISADGPLPYEVFFTNEATATASAREVVVTDQLDVANLDMTTLSLGPIAFGDHRVVPPPGLRAFVTDIDLRPGMNLLVRMQAGLDPATGVLSWHFLSLDPNTHAPPTDPLAGFLPPDITPTEGEGSVVFTVGVKAGLTTGTQIQNRATVVFDTNAPIDTPQWLNTVDRTAPTSRVDEAVPTCSGQIDVRWSGTDAGGGIAAYTIFVSESGGPPTPTLVDATGTAGSFTGQPGRTYGFFSVARDVAGNVEDAPAGPDVVTGPRVGCCSADPDCDDGNVCNGGETCDASTGACRVGVPLSCDDNEPCTRDACAPESGCTHMAIGSCSGSCPPECNDAEPCTVDRCEDGACVNEDVTGVAGASCVCERTPPASCAGEPVPAAIGKKTAKACHLLRQVANATDAARIRRLVVKARKVWRAAANLLTKRRITKGLSTACVDALRSQLLDATTRADRASG